MSMDQTIKSYVHPRQASRFFLAVFFSFALFVPFVVLFLLGLSEEAGVTLMVVAMIAFYVGLLVLVVWIGARVMFAYLLGNSILVSELNFPRIASITEEVKKKLEYDKAVSVFVYEQGSFNAFLSRMFFRRAIFLNSDVIESGVSDDEVRWLLGRFVGYLKLQRQAGFFGRLVWLAEKLIVFNIFILPYHRALAYSGDRVALLLISNDVSTALMAMQKLFVGRSLGYSLNPQGLIDQHRRVKGSFFAFLARLGSPLPHSTARYVDLLVFAKHAFPAQFGKFEAANPGLPGDLHVLVA